MAGRGQHFIPRSFLKGFVAPDGSDTLWMYRKGASDPISLGRHKAAKQRDFYSKPATDDQPTLDDQITEYETGFARKLAQLRELAVGDIPQAINVAGILVHLMVRTAHLRDVMRKSLDGVLRAFQDPELEMDRMVGFQRHLTESLLNDSMKDVISRQDLGSLTGLKQETITSIGHFFLRENADETLSSFRRDMDQHIEELQRNAKAMSEKGHQRALTNSHAPDGRVQNLEAMSWSIHAANSAGAILPDCIAIGRSEAGDWSPAVLTGAGDITAVIAPLTTDRILVGVALGSDPVDATTSNEWAATASNEFFLSHRKGSDLELLLARIGTKPDALVESWVSDAMLDIDHCSLNSERPNSESIQSAHECESVGQLGTISREGDAHLFSYEVTFLQCADDETAAEVAAQLNNIVAAFHEEFAIEHLEGVTFATDYQQALKDMDRGFEPAANPELSNTDSGKGLGTAQLVLRDGAAKWRIVTRDSIAAGLLSNEIEELRFATSIIWGLLSMVALQQYVNDSFRNEKSNQYADEYEAILYAHCEHIFGAYFSSRQSAPIYDANIDAYLEDLSTTIGASRDRIECSRANYKKSGSVETLFHDAANSAADILMSAARLLGRFDGGNDFVEHLQSARTLMEEHDLGRWFDLYHEDLRYLSADFGAWSSYRDLLLMNRHLERLLWSFSIVPERRESHPMYVHIAEPPNAQFSEEASEGLDD